MFNFLNLSTLIFTCIRIRRNQPFANPNVQLPLSNVSLAFHSYEFQQHHTRQCYLVECCRIWNKHYFVVFKSVLFIYGIFLIYLEKFLLRTFCREKCKLEDWLLRESIVHIILTSLLWKTASIILACSTEKYVMLVASYP